MNQIVKVVDQIRFLLPEDTASVADQARVTLTDIAEALGYQDGGISFPLIDAYHMGFKTPRKRLLTIDDLHKDPLLGCVLCQGCSFAKWPNAGPGYGERCDKCKLSSARPDYEPKVSK